MTVNTTSLAVLNVRRRADQRLALAHAFGWTIPAAVTDAQQRLTELARIASGVERAVTLPRLDETKPADLRGVVEQYAQAAETARLTRAAAEAMTPHMVEQYEQATRVPLTGWFAALTEAFTEAWATFKDAAPAAPLSIDGPATPDEVTAYSRLVTAAGALDRLLAARAALGQTLGEDGATEANIHLVARAPEHPHDPGTAGRTWADIGHVVGAAAPVAVTPKTQQERDAQPEWERPAWASLTSGGQHRWRRLIDFEHAGWTVSLAGPAEAAANAEHTAAWQAWAWRVKPQPVGA